MTLQDRVFIAQRRTRVHEAGASNLSQRRDKSCRHQLSCVRTQMPNSRKRNFSARMAACAMTEYEAASRATRGEDGSAASPSAIARSHSQVRRRRSRPGSGKPKKRAGREEPDRLAGARCIETNGQASRSLMPSSNALPATSASVRKELPGDVGDRQVLSKAVAKAADIQRRPIRSIAVRHRHLRRCSRA